MNIEEKHIKDKEIAGSSDANTPVLYVYTHGGLHSFWNINRDSGKVECIGAAPHREIAKWIANKTKPGIKWNK